MKSHSRFRFNAASTCTIYANAQTVNRFTPLFILVSLSRWTLFLDSHVSRTLPLCIFCGVILHLPWMASYWSSFSLVGIHDFVSLKCARFLSSAMSLLHLLTMDSHFPAYVIFRLQNQYSSSMPQSSSTTSSSSNTSSSCFILDTRHRHKDLQSLLFDMIQCMPPELIAMIVDYFKASIEFEQVSIPFSMFSFIMVGFSLFMTPRKRFLSVTWKRMNASNRGNRSQMYFISMAIMLSTRMFLVTFYGFTASNQLSLIWAFQAACLSFPFLRWAFIATLTLHMRFFVSLHQVFRFTFIRFEMGSKLEWNHRWKWMESSQWGAKMLAKTMGRRSLNWSMSSHSLIRTNWRFTNCCKVLCAAVRYKQSSNMAVKWKSKCVSNCLFSHCVSFGKSLVCDLHRYWFIHVDSKSKSFTHRSNVMIPVWSRSLWRIPFGQLNVKNASGCKLCFFVKMVNCWSVKAIRDVFGFGTFLRTNVCMNGIYFRFSQPVLLFLFPTVIYWRSLECALAIRFWNCIN